MKVDETSGGSGSVELLGVKLEVHNLHLAALLNSSVSDDVQVSGWRAREALAGAGGTARGEVRHWPMGADGSTVRVIRDDEGLDG